MSREAIRAALQSVAITSQFKKGARLIIPPALIEPAVEAVIQAIGRTS